MESGEGASDVHPLLSHQALTSDASFETVVASSEVALHGPLHDCLRRVNVAETALHETRLVLEKLLDPAGAQASHNVTYGDAKPSFAKPSFGPNQRRNQRSATLEDAQSMRADRRWFANRYLKGLGSTHERGQEVRSAGTLHLDQPQSPEMAGDSKPAGSRSPSPMPAKPSETGPAPPPESPSHVEPPPGDPQLLPGELNGQDEATGITRDISRTVHIQELWGSLDRQARENHVHDQVVIASIRRALEPAAPEPRSATEPFVQESPKKRRFSLTGRKNKDSNEESPPMLKQDTLGLRTTSTLGPPAEAWKANTGNDREEVPLPVEERWQKQGGMWIPCFRLRGRYCKVPIVHPLSKRRIMWLILCFSCTVYEAFSIPMIICFGKDPKGFWWVMEFVICLIFMADVVASFFTGYIDSTGQAVFQPGRICKRYLRTWFVVDVIASLPLEIMEWVLEVDTSKLLLLRMFRFARLARLVRMAKIRALMINLEARLEGSTTFGLAADVLKLIGGLSLSSHWAACIWFAVGNASSDQETWVEYYLQDYPNVAERYVWSLYFTLTTMTTVGYGDISPKSISEVHFALMLLPIASVLFATLMGAMTDMISNLHAKSSERNKKRMMLNHYMKSREIPQRLRMRIRQYMLYMWDTKEDFHAYEEEIKKDLPSVLREELCLHIYGNMLGRLPFLDFMKSYGICMRQLASFLIFNDIDTGDHLFQVGGTNDTIYVLVLGSMYLSLNQSIWDEDNLKKEQDQGSRLKQLKTRSKTFSSAAFAQPRDQSGALGDPSKLVMGMVETLGQKTGLERLVGEKPGDRKKKKKKGNGDGYNIFNAEILNNASNSLKVHDLRVKSIVLRMQRRWRQRQRERAASARTEQERVAAPKSGIDMRSHTVYAPAYFGESCLWDEVDVMEWSTASAPKHMYNARCQDRGQVVCIPRSAIQTVLVRFSPWLPERFGHFRIAVVEGLENMFQTKEDRPSIIGGDRSVMQALNDHNANEGFSGTPQMGEPLTTPGSMEGSQDN